MKSPLVSISCITYNHASFIKECFEGFLMQKTKFEIEILVHDDASTDGTAEIIKEYEANYPNLFKVIYQTENQYSKGLKTMNPRFNFPRARGKYIALCEGDDYWTDPYKLQKQVDFLEANPNYVITGHNIIKINEKGEVLEKKSSMHDYFKRDASEIELQSGFWIPTLSILFRNIKIKDYSIFKNLTNGDTLLIALLGKYGKYHYFSDIAPAMYRVHSGGVWSMIHTKKRQIESLKTYHIISRCYRNENNSKDISKLILDKCLNICSKNFIRELNLKEKIIAIYILGSIHTQVYGFIRTLKFCYLKVFTNN